MKIKNELLKKISSLNALAVIGISGLGGFGKSVFADLLGKKINAPVIGVDSFMKDRMLSEYHNWEIVNSHHFLTTA